MERVELSPNDKKDLLELLDYAKMKKKDEGTKNKRDKWNDANYWEIRIEQLKMVLNGYVTTPGIQSSLYTVIKRKGIPKESIDNDLADFIDYLNEKKGEDSLY